MFSHQNETQMTNLTDKLSIPSHKELIETKSYLSTRMDKNYFQTNLEQWVKV